MDLNELIELFDDNDEHLIDFIRNIRTYTIRERPNHFALWNDDEFFKRFRFKKQTVQNLLPQIEENLIYDTHQSREVDPMGQVLIALRFYATGQFYVTTGDFGGIHKTTAGRILERVTDAILALRPTYIKFPNNVEEINSTKAGFYTLARFPNVIGVVDGTHVPIQSRGGPNAEVFRSRKGFFSMNVQIISDSRNYIMDIVARWPGSAHDSHIFRNSVIKGRFENREFDGSVLLGDSAYPLTNYLMTPIPNPRTPAEELFNRAHISTRTSVERTIGIWKRRFPLLKMGIRCKTPRVQRLIIASAILHNIAVINRDQMNDPNQDENEALPLDNDDIIIPANNRNNHVLQTYINYFQTLL